jgi:glucose/arabinose dehydrogenase
VTLLLGVQIKAATALKAELFVSGLSSAPVLVTFAPGDSTRLFIVEQGGKIRIVKDDSLLASSFLDLSAIISFGGERGLLGMAFHPDYQLNGRFYVNYTNSSGHTVVRRYNVSGNPDSADAASNFDIITINQPFGNHNGGMIAFGPNDGYLYIGMGDGGHGGDPDNHAQTKKDLLGKMLRIDVDGGSPYAIPGDNPFVGDTSYSPEIWALGLRNPWRFSFDRATGDMYIADVGQGLIEEIDFQPDTSGGGENYGWRLKEGTNCFVPPTGCDTLVGLTDPITEYTHGGTPHRCSVSGGYVYRGCAIPDLQGTYFYGDFCSGQTWSFRYDGTTITDSTDRTAELGIGSTSISSYGEDYFGELYICDYSFGRIYKIVPDGVPSQCGLTPCCEGIRGDLNSDSTEANILDLNFLVNFIFRGSGDPGQCPEESDVDGDGNAANILDLNYMVNRIFRGGPDPQAC